MDIKREQIMKEVQFEISKTAKKYNGEFDYMPEDERNKLSSVFVDMFMAGFNYGINTAKQLVE
ncbi:MAG: hypothetical protein Q8936_24665 [Bacillota bacterium]|nr:hypothetical protein [Bacillota bacterium]